MRAALSAALVLGSVMTVSAAFAGPLPKDAKPMTSDEVTALYSGKTAMWKSSMAYFAPNHNTRGVFEKKIPYSGTWAVKDNEVCMVNTVKGDTKKNTDCWKYWKSGKKVLTLWSVHYDGSKPDEKNGYYNEVAALKPGDLVAATYVKVGGGDPVDGAKFKDAVVDKELHWYSQKYKMGGLSKYSADGNALLKPQTAKDWIKGVWRVDGDQFCDKWGKDKEGCSGKITRLDDKTFFQENYLGVVGY